MDASRLQPNPDESFSKLPVLATCGIHRPELAWENTLSLLLLLADFSAELYNLKH